MQLRKKWTGLPGTYVWGSRFGCPIRIELGFPGLLLGRIHRVHKKLANSQMVSDPRILRTKRKETASRGLWEGGTRFCFIHIKIKLDGNMPRALADRLKSLASMDFMPWILKV